MNEKKLWEEKQQMVREMILKYTLPDCLKPQYDGMTAWELAGMILKSLEDFDDFQAGTGKYAVSEKEELGQRYGI
jgi:hypothetical protein